MNCSGHQGTCKFCGGKELHKRYVGGMVEIDRDGKPKTDYCCRTCKNNREHAKKKYDTNASAKFDAPMPYGDE